MTLFPLPVQPEAIRANQALYQPLDVNLVPLMTTGRELGPGGDGCERLERIGNLVLLAPIGFYLPLRYRRLRAFLPTLGIVTMVAITIEIVQFGISWWVGYGYRTVDIDDVLAGIAGGVVGYVAFQVVIRLRTRRPIVG